MPSPKHILNQTKDRITRYANEGIISHKNAKYILDLNNELSAKGYSYNRQIKYLVGLSVLSREYKKDFNKANKQDMIKLVSWIRETYNGETPRDYLVILRIFIKWIREQEGQTFGRYVFPPEVSWFEPGGKNHKKKLPAHLLTTEDIKNLADHTLNLRDRALIQTLYELGCRIGELMLLKVNDVEFDKYGAIITIPLEGKTGSRKLRVVACAPAISLWLKEHSDRKNKTAPLFCGIWSKKKGLSIDYRTVYNMIQDTFERAKIDKPHNPHHFRHSRATELAKHLTEAQLCYYMGWVIGSKEARTYVHLSGRDTEKALLGMYDLAEPEKKQSKFKPIECPRCTIINDPAAKFCSGCSLGLDVKTIMEYDDQKEIAAKVGFDVQGMLGDRDFMVKMMTMMSQEWDKKQGE